MCVKTQSILSFKIINPHLSQIGVLCSPLVHPLKLAVVVPVRVSLLLRQPHEAALKGGAV